MNPTDESPAPSPALFAKPGTDEAAILTLVAELANAKKELGAVRAELAEKTTELKATDVLVALYKPVLDAIPPCPIHGECVPNALDWIEKVKQTMADRAVVEYSWKATIEIISTAINKRPNVLPAGSLLAKEIVAQLERAEARADAAEKHSEILQARNPENLEEVERLRQQLVELKKYNDAIHAETARRAMSNGELQAKLANYKQRVEDYYQCQSALDTTLAVLRRETALRDPALPGSPRLVDEIVAQLERVELDLSQTRVKLQECAEANNDERGAWSRVYAILTGTEYGEGYSLRDLELSAKTIVSERDQLADDLKREQAALEAANKECEIRRANFVIQTDRLIAVERQLANVIEFEQELANRAWAGPWRLLRGFEIVVAGDEYRGTTLENEKWEPVTSDSIGKTPRKFETLEFRRRIPAAEAPNGH